MAHKSDRIAWVDVAKGIGILAVILGHNGTRLMAAAVFPWHMPLFFMLSGLFLSARLNYAEFCRRKIKSLMLPFAATAIALIMADCCWTAYRNGLAEVPMCFVQSVLRAIGGSGSLSVFGVIGPVGAIWFLEALCLALLLVGFVANSR